MRLTSNESYKIQLIRGVAIIAVVAIHNLPEGLLQVWIRPFLNFSVGTFLFLSGMLSSADKWDPRKRIKKIIVPYLIWSMVYAIIAYHNEPSVIPIIYVEWIITGKAAAVMYYAFVYCEFVLLIPLIDKLGKSKYKYFGFFISPIEIITVRLIPLVSGIEINNYVSLLIDISCLGWFTYFYLGYLIGNDYIVIRISTLKLTALWCVGIALQVAEGYWYYSMGVTNCGTQLKLSSILTGAFFALMAYRYIASNRNPRMKWLCILGDYSFGIYFAHLAVMSLLDTIPYYIKINYFPLNVILVIIITLCCAVVGEKILGRNI